MMYDIWDIECSGQNVLSFWIGFCPFTPQATQKIKILEKWKKRLGDIILVMCAINDNHNGVWFLRYGALRTEFFIILDHFMFCYSFSPLTTQKTIFKKKNENKPWRYHHFTKVYQNSWSYATLFLRYGARRI